MDESQAAPIRQKPAEASELPREFTSTELFAGQRVVYIEHAGQSYRLLITRNDRLILQK